MQDLRHSFDPFPPHAPQPKRSLLSPRIGPALTPRRRLFVKTGFALLPRLARRMLPVLGVIAVATVLAAPAFGHAEARALIVRLDAEIVLRPDDPWLYLRRAAPRTEIGELAGARRDLRRSRRASSRHPERTRILSAIFLQRARIELLAGRSRAAVRAARRAVAKTPASWPAREVLARALAGRGCHRAAADQWQQLAERPTATPESILGLADTLVSGEQFDRSLRVLDAASARYPALSVFAERAIAIERRRGQPERALERLAELARSNSQGARWWLAHAALALEIGQPKRALGSLEAAHEVLRELPPRQRHTARTEEQKRRLSALTILATASSETTPEESP